MKPFNALRMRGAGAPPGVPTTWSPYYKAAEISLSGGNLIASSSAANRIVYSTAAKPSGKWYFEVTVGGSGSGVHSIGVMSCHGGASTAAPSLTSTEAGLYAYAAMYRGNGNIDTYAGTGSKASNTAAATYTVGDVIGVECDPAAGTAKFRKNGGAWTTVALTAAKAYCPAVSFGDTTATMTANFGASAWNVAPESGYAGWSVNTSGLLRRYWRLYSVTGFQGFSIAEAQMRLTSGGANNLSGGTPSASTTYSGLPAAQAVDGNASTIWGATSANGNNEWWMYDYGSGVQKSNVEATLQSRNDYDQYATQLLIMASDDNSNWYPAYGTTGLSWTRGQIRTFTWG